MEKIRACHRCGTEVARGAFCMSCTMELAMGLRTIGCENRSQGVAINTSQREPMEGKMRFIGTPRRMGEFLCR